MKLAGGEENGKNNILMKTCSESNKKKLLLRGIEEGRTANKVLSICTRNLLESKWRFRKLCEKKSRNGEKYGVTS